MIVHLFRGLDIDEMRRTNPHLRISAVGGQYLMLAKRGTPGPRVGRKRIYLRCCSCDIIAAEGKSQSIKHGWEVSDRGRTVLCPDCARTWRDGT